MTVSCTLCNGSHHTHVCGRILQQGVAPGGCGMLGAILLVVTAGPRQPAAGLGVGGSGPMSDLLSLDGISIESFRDFRKALPLEMRDTLDGLASLYNGDPTLMDSNLLQVFVADVTVSRVQSVARSTRVSREKFCLCTHGKLLY